MLFAMHPSRTLPYAAAIATLCLVAAPLPRTK
jgi:hypothetical protein